MRAFVLRSLCVCLLSAAPAVAQRQPPQFGSPEVSADRTVTFRFWAPHAKEVRVTAMEGQKPVAMQKDDQGIWTVKVGPLRADTRRG